MNVVNLGEATYRKSPLSGLSEALTEGVNAGTNIKNARTAAKNAETNRLQAETDAVYKPQDIAARKSALALELAKMNRTEEQNNFDNGYKLLTDVSNKADTFANDTMKEMWETSEQYKELSKVIKKYMGPEFVSADGKINYIGKQTRVEDQLKRIEGQLGQRIQAVGLEGLTQQEKDLVKYFKNPGTEALSKVYTAILEDPEFLDAQDSGDTARMASIVNKYKNEIFQDQGLGGGGQGAPAIDPSDPLGWRKQGA